MTWGTPSPPGSLTQDWAPALEDWQSSSLTSPALLPKTGKQEKVMMFEFLQFAFIAHSLIEQSDRHMIKTLQYCVIRAVTEVCMECNGSSKED